MNPIQNRTDVQIGPKMIFVSSWNDWNLVSAYGVVDGQAVLLTSGPGSLLFHWNTHRLFEVDVKTNAASIPNVYILKFALLS